MQVKELENVTIIEIFDEDERVYINWNAKHVRAELQNEGATLHIFIDALQPQSSTISPEEGRM
jgi:hypothetical protein